MKDSFDIFFDKIDQKIRHEEETDVFRKKRQKKETKNFYEIDSVSVKSSIKENFLVLKNCTREFKEKLREKNEIYVLDHTSNEKESTKYLSKNLNIIDDFTDIKLTVPIYNNLRKNYMLKPTPIQMQFIPLFLEGFNIFGQSPTGTGKTLCFLLPLILMKNEEKFGGALILLPTRELCIQIHNIFSEFVSTIGLYGHDNIFSIKIKKGDIIIATPGRISEILQKKNYIKNFTHFILDEYDKMISKEFINDIDKIYNYMQSPQVCVLAATFFKKLNFFKMDYEIYIGNRNDTNKNVIQKFKFVKNKLENLILIIEKNSVIFTNTKEESDNVAVYLQNFYKLKERETNISYKIDSLHSGREHIDRNKIIYDFHKRKIDILICTGLMARGIDFKTHLVINYSLPNTIDDYIHRIGRTGRIYSGVVKPGIAYTLCTSKDKQNFKLFEEFLRKNDVEIEDKFSIL